jgi:hypothetical protein
MPWKVSVHPDLPIVEALYSGTLTPSELSDAAGEILTLARAHGRTLVLSDCTTLVGGHSITDLYFLVDVVLASGIAHTLREAVILPHLPEVSENIRFWETACHNRGLNVRIFNDHQSALDWLLQ